MRPIDLTSWLGAREGIAHRADALAAGFAAPSIRAAVRAGEVELVRRAWLVLPSTAPDLRFAAAAGARLTCLSLARRRRWWMPEGADGRTHLHVHPGSRSPQASDTVRHWSAPLAPVAAHGLIAATEDALLHIAACLPPMIALVMWESAARLEGLAPEYLRAVRWGSPAARELAGSVTGLADSGLETLLAIPLRRWGLRVRQQVKIAGRFVDILIGDRLVVQTDGYEFHSSAAQRAKDLAHDAELRLRGYTVLRFDYAQVVHDVNGVLAVIRRAVAAGLHLA